MLTFLFHWLAPDWSVAVWMTHCRNTWSPALFHAKWTPVLQISASICLSHVPRGHPWRLLPSRGGLSEALTTPWLSCQGSVRVIPKVTDRFLHTSEDTGEQPWQWHWWYAWCIEAEEFFQKQQVSKAQKCLPRASVMVHVSDPYKRRGKT